MGDDIVSFIKGFPGQAVCEEVTYMTWEIAVVLLVSAVVVAVAGAVGEYFMRYGKEQGIVKGNYEEADYEDIRVIIKEPNKSAYFKNVKNDLDTLQEIVGGYLEGYPLATDLTVLCDEEGRIKNKPYNVSLCGLPLVGTILLIGVSNGEFTSLPGTDEEFREVFKNIFEGE